MDVARLMTPERVVGAVIWSLAHNELPDELIELVRDVLDQDTVRKMDLEGDVDVTLAMIRGGNPDQRQALIEQAANEIRITLEHLP